MGFLGDNFGFESFQLKDWWNKAKDNPEQLLLGAADPLSAKALSKVTGKKYEPFVDQMGGPYGGHTISAFGANGGGVYGRANAAGIDTKAAGGVHDAAHVVAAMFGAQGLAGAGQGMMGSVGGGAGGGAAPAAGAGWGGAGTSNAGLGVFGGGGTGGLAGVGGGNAGALAASGGITGGAGMGSATAQAPMGMQDYMKLAQQGGGGQQQQQEQPGPKPYLYRGSIVWM